MKDRRSFIIESTAWMFGAGLCAPSVFTSRSQDDLPYWRFRNYSRLFSPSSFFRPGLLYAVDKSGNRYILADLTEKLNFNYEVMISEGAQFSLTEVETAIDRNIWGDLVARALFVVKSNAAKLGLSTGEVRLGTNVLEAKRVSKLSTLEALQETPFWKQHWGDFRDLYFSLVSESIGTGKISLDFPSTTIEVLKESFDQLSELGPDTFIKTSVSSIDIISRMPLTLACNVVPLRGPGHPSKNIPSAPKPKAGLAAYTPRFSMPDPSVDRTGLSLETALLPSTHYIDAPSALVSVSPKATYGSVLYELGKKIHGAGIPAFSIYDCGFGFAIGTRFEVTEKNGLPLTGDARFSPFGQEGKRSRGYYITVSAKPTPTAYVSTKRPQDLFTMKYGLESLPHNMDQIPVEPGTTVRVYVLEFENIYQRLLPNADCAIFPQTHLEQSGLMK